MMLLALLAGREQPCQGTAGRYGIELDAALITEIDPPPAPRLAQGSRPPAPHLPAPHSSPQSGQILSACGSSTGQAPGFPRMTSMNALARTALS